MLYQLLPQNRLFLNCKTSQIAYLHIANITKAIRGPEKTEAKD
jgi:hypothetical protein